MYIGIPQAIYLFLIVLSIGISLVKHGQEEPYKYNVLKTLLSSAILIWILKAGGFFH